MAQPRSEPAASSGPWLPDGHGLDPITVDLVAEHGLRVHLRLVSPRGSARGACGDGLGELWSGKSAEVTCPGCLKVVHA